MTPCATDCACITSHALSALQLDDGIDILSYWFWDVAEFKQFRAVEIATQYVFDERPRYLDAEKAKDCATKWSLCAELSTEASESGARVQGPEVSACLEILTPDLCSLTPDSQYSRKFTSTAILVATG